MRYIHNIEKCTRPAVHVLYASNLATGYLHFGAAAPPRLSTAAVPLLPLLLLLLTRTQQMLGLAERPLKGALSSLPLTGIRTAHQYRRRYRHRQHQHPAALFLARSDFRC